jgi:seryl-tRNA synthetase
VEKMVRSNSEGGSPSLPKSRRKAVRQSLLEEEEYQFLKEFEPEGFDQASPQEKKDTLARFCELMKDYRELISVLDDTQKKVNRLEGEISQIEDQNQRLTNELADKEAVIRHLESRTQS